MCLLYKRQRYPRVCAAAAMFKRRCTRFYISALAEKKTEKLTAETYFTRIACYYIVVVTVLYTSRAHLQSSRNRHFRSGTLRAKSCRKYKHIIWLLLSRYWMFSSPRILQSAHVRNGCARACARRWSRMNNDDDDAMYIYISLCVCVCDTYYMSMCIIYIGHLPGFSDFVGQIFWYIIRFFVFSTIFFSRFPSSSVYRRVAVHVKIHNACD